MKRIKLLSLSLIVTFLLAGFSATAQANQSALHYINHAPQHALLAKILKKSGVATDLQANGPVTIFAPTDEALKALPQEKLNKLMDPAHKDMVKKVVLFHVIKGKFPLNALKEKVVNAGGKIMLKTLSGTPMEAFLYNGKVTLLTYTRQRHKVTLKAPVKTTSNAVIYDVDQVLHLIK